MRVIPILSLALFGFGAAPALAQECVACHTKVTPGIVADWKASAHAERDVDCSACHGEEHKTAEDVSKVRIPTPATCAECHEERVEEFKKGKHAAAWAAMKAMPTAHRQPAGLMEGMKGCGGCHKIGLKSESEIAALKKDGSAGFGVASCDACHTRHTFSAREARQPEACRTCHMGFDHPQWEMCSSSKHGVRYELKRRGDLPESAAAPTCQTCHMQEGNHEVRTVAGLYRDKVLSKPEAYAHPFPDLVTFHDAPTEIEQRLFEMFLKHRMRLFQGAFHSNPDYALWYGWSEMQRDVTAIRTAAKELRAAHGG